MFLLFYLHFCIFLNWHTDALTYIPRKIPNKNYSLNNFDTIPIWVVHLYQKNNNDFINNAVPIVTFFKKISDSISYCLFTVDDGVCEMTFIATQKNRKKYKSFKIGSRCDQDFANPIYSTTNYQYDTMKNYITLTIDIEKVKSKYLMKTNGGTRFRIGYNMENTELIEFSIRKVLVVNKSGNIILKRQ